MTASFYAFEGFGFSFEDTISGVGEFDVYTLMVPPIIDDDVELGDAIEVFAGDGRQFGWGEGFTFTPVGHHGEEISTVLGIGEADGIGEIITDEKRHPNVDVIGWWRRWRTIAHGDGCGVQPMRQMITLSPWRFWTTIQPL